MNRNTIKTVLAAIGAYALAKQLSQMKVDIVVKPPKAKA